MTLSGLTTSSFRATVLVVDDEPSLCESLVAALGEEPYDVVSFTDPAAAIAYLRDHRVDVVLTDLMMGEYSGVQMLNAARALQRDAITILMTAYPTVEIAVSALKCGAHDFLVKPFRLEALKAAVARGISHQRVQRNNLHLTEQVAFMQAAHAASSGTDLAQFLSLVAGSCKSEFSAVAVGILEVEPATGGVRSSMCLGDVFVDEVTSPRLVEQFSSGELEPVVVPSARDEQLGTRLFISQPIVGRGKLHGVISMVVYEKFGQISAGQLDILSLLANSAASAIENIRLYQNVRNSYLNAIRALANAIEARDQYTAGHTDRVCRLAEWLAQSLEWDSERIESLINGCTLHDIGKIGVPDAILNKTDALSPEEILMMRAHPEIGLRIIQGIKLFEPAIPYVLFHHESYDGSGYPAGLAGEEIPIEGRLLAVIDTFDAIMSDRPYRKGAPMSDAVKELRLYSGRQFDPSIVDAFLGMVEKKREAILALYAPRARNAANSALMISETVSA